MGFHIIWLLSHFTDRSYSQLVKGLGLVPSSHPILFFFWYLNSLCSGSGSILFCVVLFISPHVDHELLWDKLIALLYNARGAKQRTLYMDSA